MKERSVRENPKLEQEGLRREGLKAGLFTRRWEERVRRLYLSLIPAASDISQQIWLMTPEDVFDFDQELKEQERDLAAIEYVCVANGISDVYDIIDFLTRLRKRLPDTARLIYSNFNYKWVPLFRLAGYLRLSRNRRFGDFYTDQDLDCFFDAAGWENVKRMRRYILPFYIPVISGLLDNFLVRLPLLNRLALATFFIARKSYRESSREYKTSVLVPCKDEEGNIAAIVERLPEFGKSVEIVFIDDKSSDSTVSRIKEAQSNSAGKEIVLVQGPGRGKGAALWEGMKYASGDICMILDADLSVIPEDLPQFYEAMKTHRADFIHGTRFVYSREHGAFRFANILGNRIFSILFSYILEQRTTDTLCGTKVFWHRHWSLFEEMRAKLGDKDIWGDYNLIFGAARYGLKIAHLPVRYFERLRGTTKMNKRIKNGLTMLAVVWHALWRVKFID